MTDVAVPPDVKPALRLPPQQRIITSFGGAFRKMADVIGALMMRELHTRYGRDNVGYLWVFLEPMIFATVIGLLHMKGGTGSHYGADMSPMAFTVVGYGNFIMFRGIVNRSEGALEANAPLLYHKQLQVIDIAVAKALIELAGVLMSFLVIMSVLNVVGLASLPERPLWLFVGLGLLFWFSLGLSMLVMAGAYDIKMIERFVHVLVYFSMPISGAFIKTGWVPQPFRDYLTWSPLASIFELIRYGYFESCDDKYVYNGYVLGWCLVLTVLGLICTRSVRRRIHLH